MTPVELVDRLERLRDEVRSGYRAMTAVADVLGYTSNVTASFEERVAEARAALAVIRQRGQGHRALLGDAARREARLSLLDPAVAEPHRAAAVWLDEAAAFYEDLTDGVGSKLHDVHSRTMVRFEKLAIVRASGTDVPPEDRLEPRSEDLESAGLSHIEGPILAEMALAAARHDTVDADRLIGRALAASVDAHLERADVLFALGLVELRKGRPVSAHQAFTDSREACRVTDDFVVRDRTEAWLEAICASYAAGATGVGPAAIDAWVDCAEMIELVRGGWKVGSRPSDPLHAPFGRILGAVLVGLGMMDDPAAGTAALLVGEIGRRRGLAGLLRSGAIEDTSLSAAFGPVGDIVTLVCSAEQRSVQLGSSASEPRIRPKPVSGDDIDGSLVKELERVASRFFADAVVPGQVDIDDVVRRVRGHHVLAYSVVRDGRDRHVVRVWARPDGRATVDLFSESDLPTRHDREMWETSRLGDQSGTGLALAAALLPTPLLAELEHQDGRRPSLVIVPDGLLVGVLWNALEVQPGVALVERADVVLTVSLDLLGESSVGPSLDVPVVAAIPGEPALDVAAEVAFWEKRGVDVADRIERFDRGLSAPVAPTIAAVSAHGVGRGVLQGVVDHDLSPWTMSAIIERPWPPTVVMAVCHVGRFDWTSTDGLAPLGVPVACLARGADTVIGGVDVVIDRSSAGGSVQAVASHFTVGLLGELESHGHAATALCTVQRQWLADHRGTPLTSPDLFARMVALTRVVPPQPEGSDIA
jgi:hypothetical protein